MALVDLHLDCEEVLYVHSNYNASRGFPDTSQSGKKGHTRASDMQHVGALVADGSCRLPRDLCIGVFRNSIIRRGTIWH